MKLKKRSPRAFIDINLFNRNFLFRQKYPMLDENANLQISVLLLCTRYGILYVPVLSSSSSTSTYGT